MGLKMALKKYVETHGTHSLSIFYLRKKKMAGRECSMF